MAPRLLIEHNLMPNSFRVFLTVWDDAVRLEIEQYARRSNVGWFADELKAIAAACEVAIMRSAILPELRRLPPLLVSCEYRRCQSHHAIVKFHRGTVLKRGALGRRYVLLPGAGAKPWLAG